MCCSNIVGELHCEIVAVCGSHSGYHTLIHCFFAFLIFHVFCFSKKELIITIATAAKPFAFAHFPRYTK